MAVPPGTKKVVFYVEEDIKNRLVKVSKADGHTVSSFVAKIIRDVVEDKSK